MKAKQGKPVAVGTGLVSLDLVISMGSSRPARAWAGGTCGNVLTILSYLSWASYPFARLGDDPASQMVCSDMRRWGVSTDFATLPNCSPAPIIVQNIHIKKDGSPGHRFLWNCPHCGKHLPSYRPVTSQAIQSALPVAPRPQLCFVDRLSRGAIELARWSAEHGALVVFEPSSKNDQKQLDEFLTIAHVVKYSRDRIHNLGAFELAGSSVLLEIETAGVEGLRFRARIPSTKLDWQYSPAIPAARLVDSCGAGDWCTAGVLSKVAATGFAGFIRLSSTQLLEALTYGQELSAWNCGFEGARGGMYASVASDLLPVKCPACAKDEESRQLVLTT